MPSCPMHGCHCEERSDEAIPVLVLRRVDCHAFSPLRSENGSQ